MSKPEPNLRTFLLSDAKKGGDERKTSPVSATVPKPRRKERRLSPFHQADLTRAIKGIEKAGSKVANVKLALDGTITLALLFSENEAVNPSDAFDAWEKKHAS